MAPRKKQPRRDGEFEVERIVGDKYVGGKRFFFIKWKDFNLSENTWEPEENLGKCSSMIREYFRGKGLRNSKSHTLSTTLLRSLRVSKQRRSSISSLISVSSPKSSRKLIVSIEPVDVNAYQKKNESNANSQTVKASKSPVVKDSPKVQLERFNLPETSPVPLEPPVDPKKVAEFSVNEQSPGTQQSDSSIMSLSLHLSDESVNDYSDSRLNLSQKCSELTVSVPRVSSGASVDSKPVQVHDPAETVSIPPHSDKSNSCENESEVSSSGAIKTEQNVQVSNTDSTQRRSMSSELEPNAKITFRLFDQTPHPVVFSAKAVLNESFDDIEDSDEDLLSMNVFLDNDEVETKKVSKKRKRRKY